MNIRRISSAPVLVIMACLSCGVIPATSGISFPFFGSFGSSRQQAPSLPYNEQKEARIINADHGGSNGGAISPSSSSASFAGGTFGGPSPWISDQLVVLHPDSPLNRDVWKESGYLNLDSEHSNDFGMSHSINGAMLPSARTPPARIRKPVRKSKQQTAPPKTVTEGEPSGSTKNTDNVISASQPSPPNGGFYEFLPTPMAMLRDMNNNPDLTSDDPSIMQHEPILLPANNFLLPFSSPIFPYSPRGVASHSSLPPEAVIQLLKSPEQELSHLSRPQIKLPFPLSHDCSANNGGSGSKPLQFVVLPIVEPVAPLKPIFPKPPFLSSQYGQFPYIPPFNYFNNKPQGFPNFDGSNLNGGNQPGGGSSGQFVPILNRPAPPLPFVFVQSLPLELIGQNVEMDVLNSSPSQTSESKINEVTPIAAPPPPSASIQQPQKVPIENIPSATQPLPLIVIEKVKTPGQPPSSPVPPGAAVVEISKQSLPKSGGVGGSSPLSTISVVKPITAPGSEPHTPQQQQEFQKAIEKLVPVAAAVLENVEQQNKQKEGKDQESTTSLSSDAPTTPKEQDSVATSTVAPPKVVKGSEQERASPLRPSLRPDATQDQVKDQQNTEPIKPVSEEIVGIGVNPTSMSDLVEITEA